MRILSITTADYSSYSTGILMRFLESCKLNKVEVFLVLRNFERSIDESFSPEIRAIYVPQMSLSNARNQALAFLAKSKIDLFEYDFIAFLDDDCEVTDSISYLANAKPCSDIVVGSYGPSIIELAERFKYAHSNPENLGTTLNRVASCTLYFKPNVIIRLGGFFPEIGVPNVPFSKGEDTEFFLRAIEFGFCYEIIAQVFVKHPYREERREFTILSDLLLSFSYMRILGMSRFLKLSSKTFYFLLLRKIALKYVVNFFIVSRKLRFFTQ